MLNVAYIFPGQGAQYVGMGEDFYQRYPQAREIFDCADRLSGLALSELIFKGPLEELTKTVNCQIAIFTTSVAFLQSLKAEALPVTVRYTAGLSLGEYAALVAAGALDFKQGLKLVKMRAQYMEEASQANPGGMLSLIGLPLNVVEKVCEQARVEIANLNCPGQIVISGRLSALDKAGELALKLGARKVIPLKVSGAFHSSLMRTASQQLTEALKEIEIRPSKIPVVSNVTAAEEGSPTEIKDNLSRQVVHRTRWEDSINFISSCGVKHFLEVGPGKVLKGLLRRIEPELQVYNIETVQDLEQFREECLL